MNTDCEKIPNSSRSKGRNFIFFAPLLILHISCVLIFFVGVSEVAVIVFFILTFLKCFGITAGYHRLLAHRAYKTSRTFQFLIASLGVLAGQNGPLWWVSHHRHHHRHSDTSRDVHSPKKGFFWSHMGWLFSPDCIKSRNELIPDLVKFPELHFLHRYYYAIHLGCGGLLFALGEGLGAFHPGLQTSGFQLVVWGGIVSTVCTYHMIWSANSFCHKYGSRRFETRDNSRNNAIVAVLTLGDGWHNNHHQFPGSARHGLMWWEIDINYLILKLLSFFGIVWDIKIPPESAYAPR